MLWDKNNIGNIRDQSSYDSIRLNNCYYDDGIRICMDPVIYVANLSDYRQQIFDYQYIHSFHDLRYEEHISSNAIQHFEISIRDMCRCNTILTKITSVRTKLYAMHSRKR